MNVRTVRAVVRPLKRVLTTATVTAVAATGVVSAGTTLQATGDPGSAPAAVSAQRLGAVGPAKKESVRLAPAKKESVRLAPARKEMKKEIRKEMVTFELAAQQASPALRVSSYQHRVIVAINRVRKRHHLRTLTKAGCAQTVASRWSRKLAAHDAFHHQSMPALLKRCNARYVGETLARGSVTPNRIVRMWLDSPPHRHILLSRSPRRIGVGATPDSHGQWVVTGEFMRF